jgi:protocatechuate 3,4-dioxygenase, beta subunit
MSHERKMEISRRGFLLSTGMLGATAVSGASASEIGEFCRNLLTPTQPEGPFYPIHDQLDKDNDLTRIENHQLRATGQLLYVRGQVMNQNCAPVKNALVEIWQACESGRYNHPGDDQNQAPLDEHFQYWGQCVTGEQGEYLFKTIIPGSYSAGDDWIRPPHIHFKVSALGHHELITQMYFLGEKYNDTDLILQRLPRGEQDSVVVNLQEPSSNEEPSSKVAQFNIVLKKIARSVK